MSEEEAIAAEDQFTREHPFSTGGFSSPRRSATVFESGSFADQNARANAGIYDEKSFGAQNAAANGTGYAAKKEQAAGFMSQGIPPEPTGEGLGAPGADILAILKKKPGDRTSAELTLLNARRQNEAVATKRGGKVMNGISGALDAEDAGMKKGRENAIGASTYADTYRQAAGERGYDENGKKIAPGQPVSAGSGAPSNQPPATSGWRDKATAMTADMMRAPDPNAPSSAPATPTPVNPFKPAGFAMRMMPDGTVRTASGMAGANKSNMQQFSTREAAMAQFRPAPGAMPQQPMTAPVGPGQPVPAAQQAVPARAPAPAAAPAPAPAIDPAMASPFTSPTAKLNMGMAQAAQAPAPAQSQVAPRPMRPQGSLYGNPAPIFNPSSQRSSGMPEDLGNFATASEIFGRTAPNSVRNQMPQGSSPYGEPSKVMLGTAQRELGTPRRSGYQQQAEELSPTR